MKYIERINMFWVLHEGNQFSTTEIALYFYLLKVANLLGWPDSFKRNNAKILIDLSVSFKTLAKARNRLKQANLIDYKTINGSPNVSYTFGNFPKVGAEVGDDLMTFGNIPKVSAEVGAEVRDEVSAEVRDDINKRIQDTGYNNPLPLSKKKKPLTLPFDSDRFKELWGVLTQMPKWKKKPLTALNLTLKKLARYEEGFACELISRAIEGNYQGVVFSDTDDAFEKWKRKEGRPGQILTPEDDHKKQKLLQRWK